MVIAVMERNLTSHQARLRGRDVAGGPRPGQATARMESAAPVAPMAQSESAASLPSVSQQEEAVSSQAPSSADAPPPRPAGAPVPAAAPSPQRPKAPPGLKRQLREPSPQARRALQKALDDYQQALELLKTRIERHHQERQQPDR